MHTFIFRIHLRKNVEMFVTHNVHQTQPLTFVQPSHVLSPPQNFFTYPSMNVLIPVNSYIVSGFSMLFFNFVLLGIVKLLCQSICCSANIYRIYEQRLSLAPRRSRLAGVFGGPVGHIKHSRILSVVIAIYAVIVVLIDFSINGVSQTVYEPTVYKSMVQRPPTSEPLDIDYENELKIEGGSHLVSTRLVALASANECMNLNFSHHTMMAYAFEDTHIDKTLRPVNAAVKGGTCVTHNNFKTPEVLFSFRQAPYPDHACELDSTPLSTSFEEKRLVGTAQVPREKCNITITSVGCFRETPRHDGHCAAIGDIADSKGNNRLMVLLMRNASNPKGPEIHEMREFQMSSTTARVKLATNIAFLSAVGFRYSSFTSMYMTLSAVHHNVTLYRKVKHNYSEVNLSTVLPIFVVVTVTVLILSAYAFAYWYKFVHKKGRQNYISFYSVEETLGMMQSDGLRKGRGCPWTRNILLSMSGRPVLSEDA